MKRWLPAMMAALIVIAPTLSQAKGDDLNSSAARFVESHQGKTIIGAMASAGMTKKQRDSRLRELLHRGLMSPRSAATCWASTGRPPARRSSPSTAISSPSTCC